LSLPGDVTAYLEDPARAGDLPGAVLAYARRERLFTAGDRVLVSVSGGPDSVALLHLLVRLRPELGLELGVAHFDHGLRGKASQGDADFVNNLARRLDLPCYLGTGKVKEAARQDKISVQMAARKLRRQFFQDIRNTHGYNKLALGHTADDQVELFWLRLLRGAGLEGLKGMAPATAEGLVRPLLAVGKAVLLAWLKQENLPYRIDVSNLSRAYLRNRVRLDLMPYLSQRYNPRLAQTIWRTQALLRKDELLLRRDTAAAWERLARKLAADCFALDLKKFHDLQEAMQRRVLRFGVNRISADLTFSAAQVEALSALVRSEKSGGLVSLEDKVQVARSGAVLHIFTALPEPSPEVTLLSDVPGEVNSPQGWRWRRSRRAHQLGDPWPAPEVAWLNPARVLLPLEVRAWRPGDRFWPQGAAGRKKLQDFLVNAKIPRWLRPHLPLVACAQEVIWMPGLRLAEPVKLLPASRELLELSLTPATPTAARVWEILHRLRPA
jgi:tRNA(Ile)-lysidine synthase